MYFPFMLNAKYIFYDKQLPKETNQISNYVAKQQNLIREKSTPIHCFQGL